MLSQTSGTMRPASPERSGSSFPGIGPSGRADLAAASREHGSFQCEVTSVSTAAALNPRLHCTLQTLIYYSNYHVDRTNHHRISSVSKTLAFDIIVYYQWSIGLTYAYNMLICISGYHNRNITTMYHSHIVLIQFHSAVTWLRCHPTLPTLTSLYKNTCWHRIDNH